jgi:hypothetical protein
MCPKCGALLKATQIVAAGPFPCPNCNTKLQASSRYGEWIAVGSLALSIVASLVLGFRGFHLLYAVLPLLVVIDFLALNLLKYACRRKSGLRCRRHPFAKLFVN